MERTSPASRDRVGATRYLTRSVILILAGGGALCLAFAAGTQFRGVGRDAHRSAPALGSTQWYSRDPPDQGGGVGAPVAKRSTRHALKGAEYLAGGREQVEGQRALEGSPAGAAPQSDGVGGSSRASSTGSPEVSGSDSVVEAAAGPCAGCPARVVGATKLTGEWEPGWLAQVDHIVGSHTPKTGGTSFRHLMRGIVEVEGWSIASMYDGIKVEFPRADPAHPARILYGHEADAEFAAKPPFLSSLEGRKGVRLGYLTVLRDPWDQIVSQYEYGQSGETNVPEVVGLSFIDAFRRYGEDWCESYLRHVVPLAVIRSRGFCKGRSPTDPSSAWEPTLEDLEFLEASATGTRGHRRLALLTEYSETSKALVLRALGSKADPTVRRANKTRKTHMAAVATLATSDIKMIHGRLRAIHVVYMTARKQFLRDSARFGLPLA